MADFFDSSSAIERGTGMTVDEWLAFNGYGEREATIRTLRNLTQLERPEREKMERENNIERLQQLASAGMSLFVDGEVNSADIIYSDNLVDICENDD